MHQVTLALDHDDHPNPVMAPEREQQLIALMARALVAVLQSHTGEDHEAA